MGKIRTLERAILRAKGGVPAVQMAFELRRQARHAQHQESGSAEPQAAVRKLKQHRGAKL